MPVQHANEDDEGQLSCTHTSLWRAARQLTQLYDEALSPSGFTSSQARLVGQIYALDGQPGGAGPTLQFLARRLGIQISALTHAMRPLVRDGLVTVHADAKDGRTKRAVLTAAGERQTELMITLWGQTNARLDQSLGAGVTEQLRVLADQIIAPGFLAAYSQTKPPQAG